MEFDVAENFLVGQEVDFGTALLGIADDLQRRYVETCRAFSIARSTGTPRQNSMKRFLPSRRMVRRRNFDSIDAGNANAMQAARYLVGVLVELAAGVQFRQCDFGCRTLGSCLSSILTPVGMPRPLSMTEIELSVWMVTMMSSQCPARASSMELSTTSKTR